MMAEQIMVAMSGGVDSSVAAALLKEQGFEVCGVTLKLFSNGDIGLPADARPCCSLADVEDARRVAYRLGFYHYVFNFTEQFRRQVIDRFAAAYADGETPNPCIDCNRYIKFSLLLDRAAELQIYRMATGHYARVEYEAGTGRYLLKKARDESKDQTYVLYAMTQDQLRRTTFPLGGLLKSEVRALAEARGLVNAGKPDSQDICFVQEGSYAGFLEQVLGLPSCPGNFTDSGGRVLGTHKGILHYTVGQRRGLGLSFGRRSYVLGKEAASNTVTLGGEEELYRSSLTVRDVNLIPTDRLDGPTEAAVKIRYSRGEAPAVLYPLEDGCIRVRFREPQRAAAPGQAAVFYDGDLVLGGGTIV